MPKLVTRPGAQCHVARSLYPLEGERRFSTRSGRPQQGGLLLHRPERGQRSCWNHRPPAIHGRVVARSGTLVASPSFGAETRCRHTGAACLLINHLFDATPIERLQATVVLRNEGSGRVAEAYATGGSAPSVRTSSTGNTVTCTCTPSFVKIGWTRRRIARPGAPSSSCEPEGPRGLLRPSCLRKA